MTFGVENCGRRKLVSFPPPMFSVPAGAHFIGQFLRVEAQKVCHLGAVLAEENQLTVLPILPSRPVNTEPASGFAG